MDFNPNHPKWQCCCWHLTTGLKILGAVEVVIGSAALAFLLLLITSDSEAVHPWTEYTCVVICLSVILSSALLLVGIQKLNGQLLYPTLIVKGICIVVAHGLVVFNVLQPYHAPGTEHTPEEKPPVARLVFAIFLVMFISVGILYTMYLVVHCQRYLRGARRLEDRKRSVLHASQIIFEE